MTKKEPGKIVAVRRISPLIVGLGEGETFLASDIPAVLHRTRDFMIVEDGEINDHELGRLTLGPGTYELAVKAESMNGELMRLRNIKLISVQ